jgi:hypothetical protein
MFDGFTLDAEHLLIAAVVGVGVLVLLYFLWGELRHRARRYGGDDRAAIVMLGAVILLVIAITPGLLPTELALAVLVVCLGSIYRPDLVVRTLGGPDIRWRALREGRELQVLVAERGGPDAAASDVEISQRVAALTTLESPETRPYLQLVREGLLADPDSPDGSLRRARLAEADRELRASLGARPAWERELEKRLAAATGNTPG